MSFSGVAAGKAAGGKKGGAMIGVICGEASNHYLIRQNTTWIPVLKSSLFSSKGEPLPPIAFRDLKLKRVFLLQVASHSPQAHLLDDSSGDHPDDVLNIRLESEGLVDRDCETDIGVSDEETRRVIELQATLATDLFTDVAALTALRTDHARSLKYMRSRASRIKKSVDSVFTAVKTIDAHMYASARPTCLALFANLDLLTTESEVHCAGCRETGARVGLSCGHKVCVGCGNALISFSSDLDVKLHSCPVCHHELTLTDGKLILLEKYEDLKRSEKHPPVA